ncbi:hypothetical protein [Streptomyces sp. DH7]|nr:hypothetical protein [Streptomyces sp. DH7]
MPPPPGAGPTLDHPDSRIDEERDSAFDRAVNVLRHDGGATG